MGPCTIGIICCVPGLCLYETDQKFGASSTNLLLNASDSHLSGVCSTTHVRYQVSQTAPLSPLQSLLCDVARDDTRACFHETCPKCKKGTTPLSRSPLRPHGSALLRRTFGVAPVPPSGALIPVPMVIFSGLRPNPNVFLEAV